MFMRERQEVQTLLSGTSFRKGGAIGCCVAEAI
jgi:hypothetical protein